MDWFATQAGLSLEIDNTPPGTFNYIDDQEYSPAEALSILNRSLLSKGFVLIRRDRMLKVWNLADPIPPWLVDTITPEEIDKRGDYEILSVLFNLEKLTPAEAEGEIAKLKGPQGVVVTLPKSRQIQVTDMGVKLKDIHKFIQRAEDPLGLLAGQIATIELQHEPPERVLPVVRSMLEFPEDKNVSTDGSLRFAVDPTGKRILVSGTPEKIARMKEIVRMVDIDGPGVPKLGGIELQAQIEKYSITSADPQVVFNVLQTMMQGLPDVRLALDTKSNIIIAQARPAEQATIKATIEQLDSHRPMAVIRLHSLDPQLAVAAINKMFGITDAKTPPANAPQVDADVTTRQLLVHGTEGQIAQIRQLLEQMGETEIASATAANDNKVRMLTVSPRSARAILEQIQNVWPVTHKNRIREVAPSAVIPSMIPGADAAPSDIPQRTIDRTRDQSPKDMEPPQRGEPPLRGEPPRMLNPGQPAAPPAAGAGRGRTRRNPRGAAAAGRRDEPHGFFRRQGKNPSGRGRTSGAVASG